MRPNPEMVPATASSDHQPSQPGNSRLGMPPSLQQEEAHVHCTRSDRTGQGFSTKDRRGFAAFVVNDGETITGIHNVGFDMSAGLLVDGHLPSVAWYQNLDSFQVLTSRYFGDLCALHVPDREPRGSHLDIEEGSEGREHAFLHNAGALPRLACHKASTTSQLPVTR